MNNLKEKIYIQQWLDFKPYNSQTKTDLYYLRVCNKVKEALHFYELQWFLRPEEINDLACFLTFYFEDIISETNIWNSFIKINIRLYGKPLPFYDVSEYFEEEINFQDVCFLIWYFLNTVQEDSFYNPVNRLAIEIAKDVMDVLDEEWDYAPENQILKDYYSLPTETTDYYESRNLIDNILFNSYLFYFDTYIDLLGAEHDIIEDYKNDVGDKDESFLLSYLRENRDSKVHNLHTRLLALKGKDWAAEIVGVKHPLHDEFLNISKRIRGYFLYKGQDEENVYLEHVASSKKFNLTKKSFDHSDNLHEIDTILFIGIVRWMNEWWFSGVFFTQEFNADLVLDEKNSVESRNAVSFLDHKNAKSDEFIQMQYEAFLEYNNNQPIAFLKGDQIDEFIKGYIQYFNNSLNLSKKERNESKRKAKKEGFFKDLENSPLNFGEDTESGLVFFNPKGGIEVARELNSAFPDPNNPFFNKSDCKDHLMGILVSESISASLAKYCIKQHKTSLPFFETSEGKIILENIDFLLRFWKSSNYFSEVEITYTGIN